MQKIQMIKDRAGKTGQGRAVCGGRSPVSSGVALGHGMLSSPVLRLPRLAARRCSTGCLAHSQKRSGHSNASSSQGLLQDLGTPHHLRKAGWYDIK